MCHCVLKACTPGRTKRILCLEWWKGPWIRVLGLGKDLIQEMAQSAGQNAGRWPLSKEGLGLCRKPWAPWVRRAQEAWWGLGRTGAGQGRGRAHAEPWGATRGSREAFFPVIAKLQISCGLVGEPTCVVFPVSDKPEFGARSSKCVGTARYRKDPTGRTCCETLITLLLCCLIHAI